MMEFVIDFVAKHDLVTQAVVDIWTTHVEENITDSNGVHEWLGFVKLKVGLAKYKEIKQAWTNECRKDHGFEEIQDFKVFGEVYRDMTKVATY